MNIQETLRDEVKRLRWEENITYKDLATDLLEMDYHAFINWLHGRTNLGSQRIKQLQDFINCIR